MVHIDTDLDLCYVWSFSEVHTGGIFWTTRDWLTTWDFRAMNKYNTQLNITINMKKIQLSIQYVAYNVKTIQLNEKDYT